MSSSSTVVRWPADHAGGLPFAFVRPPKLRDCARTLVRFHLIAGSILAACAAFGQPATNLEEIVVDGAGSTPAGFGPSPAVKTTLSPSVAALPANTTVIDASELARLPVQTYGDIFRPVAGFDVANYGQGGVGYGIALRGFSDAEHGRDIAFFIDGVPMNEVSSLHIPGYVDLNSLIPETVGAVRIVRGPFSVEAGDTNRGGAVFLDTKQSEPFDTLNVAGGSFGTVRGLATVSQTGPGIQPYLAYEGYDARGFRDNSELYRFNAFNKVTVPLDPGSSLSLRVQAYGTSFRQPGFLQRDLVLSGKVSPRAAFNPSDAGAKTLQTFVANYSNGPAPDELSAVLWGSHDVYHRFSDFGGGQLGQLEERETGGGRVRKVTTTRLLDVLPTQILLGGDWRTDGIDAVQGPTFARNLTGRTVDLDDLQTNLAAYAQVQVQPFPWLKFTGGARFDQFFYKVHNYLDPALSPRVDPNVLSPKGGVAITPFQWMELFSNYGQGFRSPSATSELTSAPGLAPQTLDSMEGGGRLVTERASLTGTVFFTNISNETFQAAEGLPVQNLGRSRRDGFEIEAKYLAYRSGSNRLSLFANYAGVSARLLNGAPSIYVPNVPAYLANIGTEFDLRAPSTRLGSGRLIGSAYLSFVGAKPLTEDGLLRSTPYTRLSGRLAFLHESGWTTFAQATIYPGDRTSESIFNFGASTVTAASSDIYTSPLPRLTLLAGLTYGFSTSPGAR